jgi:hypothetical protein
MTTMPKFKETLDERAARLQRRRDLADAKKQFREIGAQRAYRLYIELGGLLSERARGLAGRFPQLNELVVGGEDTYRIVQGAAPSLCLVLNWRWSGNARLEDPDLTATVWAGIPPELRFAYAGHDGRAVKRMKFDCEPLALDAIGYVDREANTAYGVEALADHLLFTYLDEADA